MSNGVETGCGLIEEDEVRVVEKRLCDAYSLKHSLGILPEGLIRGVREADAGKEIVDKLFARVLGDLKEVRIKAQDLSRGHILVEIRALRQVGDALLDFDVAGGSAEHDSFSAGRKQES